MRTESETNEFMSNFFFFLNKKKKRDARVVTVYNR